MANQMYRPVMIAVESDDRELLESVRTLKSESVHTGEVNKTRRIEDHKLDPWAVAHLTYQVIGAIATIGGAVQFVSWVIEKVKAAKSTAPIMCLEVGSTRIEISGTDNPAELRQRLIILLEAEEG